MLDTLAQYCRVTDAKAIKYPKKNQEVACMWNQMDLVIPDETIIPKISKHESMDLHLL